MKVPSHLREQTEGAIDWKGVDMPNLTAEQRFWAKVEKTDGCWLWTAYTLRGYGQFYHERHHVYAHRFAYESQYGAIGDRDLDHKCRNRSCVRPDHLRPATRKQNMEHLAPRANTASGVRGVSWDKHRNKWNAQVMHSYKAYNVGRFDTIEEAAEAVRLKRIELFTHNDLDMVEQ